MKAYTHLFLLFGLHISVTSYAMQTKMISDQDLNNAKIGKLSTPTKPSSEKNKILWVKMIHLLTVSNSPVGNIMTYLEQALTVPIYLGDMVNAMTSPDRTTTNLFKQAVNLNNVKFIELLIAHKVTIHQDDLELLVPKNLKTFSLEWHNNRAQMLALLQRHINEQEKSNELKELFA